uniref:Uncharacterized protein n=1 Tax=Triticum urartu TaxID=4572 RepID=A0A8R7QIF6_TRIUA
MLRTMPRTLALSAVQRHTAASRSARPPRRLQHLSPPPLGGLPTPTFTRPSTLAQAPSFSVSVGHDVPPDEGGGHGVVDGDGGGGDGEAGGGVWCLQLPQASPARNVLATSSASRHAAEKVLDAIAAG